MGHTKRTLVQFIIAIGAVGALALATSGVAAAAAPATSGSMGSPGTSLAQGAPASSVAGGSGRPRCVRAERVLVRIQRIEARIDAGLPRLTKAEAGAKAAGNTARADRIQRAITELESPALTTRLDRLSARIIERCGPPARGSST
ncbi:MAG: hypothetical protein ABSB09_12230 [Acidimicrobiales bacterium]|jgi:hypothetical protein